MIFNLTYYYFIIFAISLGISLGLISSYLVVKKWSMLGDIISHAALPGIVTAFFLTHSTAVYILILGGFISSLFSVLLSFYLQKIGKFPRESSFALILSWFFSFGIIVMNIIQKKSIPGQSILNSFIFGNILMINHNTIIYYVIYALLLLLFTIYSIKKQEFFSFDQIFSYIKYKSVFIWEIIFLIISILTIIIALQSVGILLIGGLIILPGSFARLLSNSYATMTFFSVLYAITVFTLGIITAFHFTTLPTGPIIVLIAVSLFFILFLYKKYTGRL